MLATVSAKARLDAAVTVSGRETQSKKNPVSSNVPFVIFLAGTSPVEFV